MISSSDIIGQQEIITHLKNARKYNKVSNAYIIDGEKGSGKKLIARYFAMLLNCEDESLLEPCGVCSSCIKARSNNQPDIIYVTHQKENTISVEEIRNQIVLSMDIKPYSSKYKIYVVPDADKMTISAQNAILKTLEEPPEYGVIILLVENKEKLLPTVLSRGIKLDIKPVKKELMIDYFVKTKHIEESEIGEYINLSNGNIGKLERLMTDTLFNEIKNNAIIFADNIDAKKNYDIEKVRIELKEWKENISAYLEMLAIWYRDILVFKATSKENNLYFNLEKEKIQIKAEKYSYEKINNSINAVENAKRRISNNVNYDLTMEILFLDLRKQA